MKYFEADSTINASPDKVWSVLTDGAKFPEWDDLHEVVRRRRLEQVMSRQAPSEGVGPGQLQLCKNLTRHTGIS